MNARTLLAALSAGRIFFGLVMLVAPKAVGRSWFGSGGATAESAALMRVGGIRDVAYGVGGLAAARSGADPKPWLGAAIFVDGTDAYATATAEGVPKSKKIPAIAVALSAAISGAVGLTLPDED
jgi:hypothetical protein